MGKIISLVGNPGAGKTTLTRLICEQGGFTPYWEKPAERPFQAQFMQDLPRWALANQVDFLLFRCQQEGAARQRGEVAVFDGGLDQDFQVFTRYCFQKGYLRPDEFNLCQRFYAFARECLPPPDVIVHLEVPMPALLARRASRQRETIDQSFDPQELIDHGFLLEQWLEGERASPVLRIPFEQGFHTSPGEIEALIAQLKVVLGASDSTSHSVGTFS